MPNYKIVDVLPRKLPRKLAEYYYCKDGKAASYSTPAVLRSGSGCTLVEAGGQKELTWKNFKNADVSSSCTSNTSLCYCMQQCDNLGNECLAILYDDTTSKYNRSCKLYNCAPDDMEWEAYSDSDNTTFMYMKSTKSTVEAMCEDTSSPVLYDCNKNTKSGCGTVEGPYYNDADAS